MQCFLKCPTMQIFADGFAQTMLRLQFCIRVAFYSVPLEQTVLNVIFLASDYSHQVWDAVCLVLIVGTACFKNILDSWTEIWNFMI